MKKFVYITLTFLLIPLFFVHAYTFSRSLSLGSEGEDVRELQKLLNQNQQTQVAQEGAGSPGNETTYFGPKTKDAVIRFQNMYAQDILIPNGLSAGTGFVGISTLSFINSLQKSDLDIQNQTHTTSTGTSILNDAQFFISARTIRAGDTLYIGSQRDISNSDFFLSGSQLKKKCYTDFTCELLIDKKTKTEIYTLSSSDTLLGQAQISVFDLATKKPEVNLKKLSLAQENIVKGKNFSSKMVVYTLYGIFETETTNDSFVLDFSTLSIGSTTSMMGPFYVENENGLASDILDIQYEI